MQPAPDANDYLGEYGLASPPRRMTIKSTTYLINAADTAYVELHSSGQPAKIALPEGQSASAVLKEYRNNTRVGAEGWLTVIVKNLAFYIASAVVIGALTWDVGTGVFGALFFLLFLVPAAILDERNKISRASRPRHRATLPVKDHAHFFHHATNQDTNAVNSLLIAAGNSRLGHRGQIDTETKLQEILTRYTHHHLTSQQRKQLIDKRIEAKKLELKRAKELEAARRKEDRRMQQQLAAQRAEQEQRQIAEQHERIVSEQTIAAQRERRTRLRTQARGQWRDTIARHEQLRQEYLDTEMNYETILTMPTLRDVTDPHTKKMFTAMNRADNTPNDMPSYLLEDADPDTPVLDIHTEPYIQRVEEFDSTWRAAVANAKKIGLNLVPQEERRTIATIQKLLTQAANTGATDQERRAFYARAHEQLQTLTHVTIPQRAMIQIEADAAGMLEA